MMSDEQALYSLLLQAGQHLKSSNMKSDWNLHLRLFDYCDHSFFQRLNLFDSDINLCLSFQSGITVRPEHLLPSCLWQCLKLLLHSPLSCCTITVVLSTEQQIEISDPYPVCIDSVILQDPSCLRRTRCPLASAADMPSLPFSVMGV